MTSSEISKESGDNFNLKDVTYWLDQDDQAFRDWEQSTALVEEVTSNKMPTLELTPESMLKIRPHLEFEKTRRRLIR